jgi:nucleolin
LLKNNDGSSKGIAFVRFAEESAANQAVEYNGSEHMGRTLVIERTKPRVQGGAGGFGGAGGAQDAGESTTLFIGNLGFDSVEDSLRAVFTGCGNIKDVRIAKDQEGYVILINIRQSRGFGYVEFYDTASVQKGLLKAGEFVDGRAIRVDVAQTKQRTGGGDRGGFGGGRGGFGGGRGGFGGGRGGDRGGFGGRGGRGIGS